ncbi:MAG: polysaccharide biosynthesis/export family protein [Coprobacter sp.]|nr:polysaccharide biosynthesis/export family protein [Coprobacter sp.]
MKKSIYHLLSAAAIAVLLGACSAAKKVTYLQDIQPNVSILLQEVQSIRLQPGDKLSIVIHSRDKELVSIFNLFDGTGEGNGNHSLYTVDDRGYIDMPVLGPIKVEGLTRQELANLIKYRLLESKLVKEPTVVVEYANLGYYFLGELSGRKTIDRDHITLLEALSEAGDLPLTANRENILVLRTEKGVQVPYRVSLLSVEELYSSPVYYLQQNDIIYIEPILIKKNQTNIHGNTFYTYGFWTSIASTAISLIVLFLNLKKN